MSDYIKTLESLKSMQCPICLGRGKVDDADLGDIFFNEWECPECKGAGFESEWFCNTKIVTAEQYDEYQSLQAERDALVEKTKKLEALLHSRMRHPDYEYTLTSGPRKRFDEDEPEGEGWERNIHMGRDGWERFDYHEEAYWMRLKAKP